MASGARPRQRFRSTGRPETRYRNPAHLCKRAAKVLAMQRPLEGSPGGHNCRFWVGQSVMMAVPMAVPEERRGGTDPWGETESAVSIWAVARGPLRPGEGARRSRRAAFPRRFPHTIRSPARSRGGVARLRGALPQRGGESGARHFPGGWRGPDSLSQPGIYPSDRGGRGARRTCHGRLRGGARPSRPAPRVRPGAPGAGCGPGTVPGRDAPSACCISPCPGSWLPASEELLGEAVDVTEQRAMEQRLAQVPNGWIPLGTWPPASRTISIIC